MEKSKHPQMQNTKFICASCKKEFDIQTTLKNKEFSIDTCSECHPFYTGDLSMKVLRGRADKLSTKFATGKEVVTNKPVKKEKVRKVRESKGLDSL